MQIYIKYFYAGNFFVFLFFYFLIFIYTDNFFIFLFFYFFIFK